MKDFVRFYVDCDKEKCEINIIKEAWPLADIQLSGKTICLI